MTNGKTESFLEKESVDKNVIHTVVGAGRVPLPSSSLPPLSWHELFLRRRLLLSSFQLFLVQLSRVRTLPLLRVALSRCVLISLAGILQFVL